MNGSVTTKQELINKLVKDQKKAFGVRIPLTERKLKRMTIQELRYLANLDIEVKQK